LRYSYTICVTRAKGDPPTLQETVSRTPRDARLSAGWSLVICGFPFRPSPRIRSFTSFNIYVLAGVVGAWLAVGTTPESLQASWTWPPFNLPNSRHRRVRGGSRSSASSSIKGPGFTPPCRWLIRQDLFTDGNELAERLDRLACSDYLSEGDINICTPQD
jgi:hypothetical protein